MQPRRDSREPLAGDVRSLGVVMQGSGVDPESTVVYLVTGIRI